MRFLFFVFHLNSKIILENVVRGHDRQGSDDFELLAQAHRVRDDVLEELIDAQTVVDIIRVDILNTLKTRQQQQEINYLIE